MQTEDLRALIQAKSILDEIVMARYVDMQGPGEISATEFDAMSATEQQSERDTIDDHALGHRARAAIHLCLSASSVVMEVSVRLMSDFAHLSRKDRINLFSRCAEDATAASVAAEHASALLSDKET